MFPYRIALVLAVWVTPQAPALAQEKKPLVTRDRIQLNLAGAEMVLETAKKKAAALGLKCNVAIVDDGGHLLAFARMDGARPASATTALTKAVSAAIFRQETGPMPAKGEPDLLLSLSLQNAAAASGGKITTLKGGVPIVINGQVVGAVGVGGGTGEQDAEVAKAGIQTLLDALDDKR
jgi:glc operon protein GlcG